MLGIRPEQMAVLREPARAVFEDKMVVHLRSAFSSAVLGQDDAALRAMIRRMIDRAARHRVCKTHDVSRYIEYAAVHGEDFDALPWARPILDAPDGDGTAR